MPRAYSGTSPAAESARGKSPSWSAAVAAILCCHAGLYQQRPVRPGPGAKENAMTEHKVVSRAEWRAARDELLRREKEHTRLGDELARQRGELPWVAVEQDYRFDTDDGPKTL